METPGIGTFGGCLFNFFNSQISFVHKLKRNTVSIDNKHRAKITEEGRTLSLDVPLNKI